MLLTTEKACRLIGGLTVAGFFFGFFLGYNNVWIWEPSFQCTRGSKECADGWFCNRDFKGIHGYCESCEWIQKISSCEKESFKNPAGNRECAARCSPDMAPSATAAPDLSHFYPDPDILGNPCIFSDGYREDCCRTCDTVEMCFLDWNSTTGHCTSCDNVIPGCEPYWDHQDLWFECVQYCG